MSCVLGVLANGISSVLKGQATRILFVVTLFESLGACVSHVLHALAELLWNCKGEPSYTWVLEGKIVMIHLLWC